MDFALILFIALVLTGAVALWDRLRVTGKLNTSVGTGRSAFSDTDKIVTKEKSSPSIVVEYARAFFPVILLVFVLRSFVVEPFRIRRDRCCRPCILATSSWWTSSDMGYDCRLLISESFRRGLQGEVK